MTYQMWTRVEKQKPDSQICCQVTLRQSSWKSSAPRSSLRAPWRLRLPGALPALLPAVKAAHRGSAGFHQEPWWTWSHLRAGEHPDNLPPAHSITAAGHRASLVGAAASHSHILSRAFQAAKLLGFFSFLFPHGGHLSLETLKPICIPKTSSSA